ncbi:MAG: hypothetical protein SFU99_13985 [Saprospiraceae bacterium]|nr:hypothetical protein [Saprospiraceae bacterium]
MKLVITLAAIILAVLFPAMAAYLLCSHLTGGLLFLCFGRVNVATMIYPIILAFWNRNILNQPLKVFFIYCIATFCINLIEQLFILGWINNYEIVIEIVEYLDIENTNFMLILYHLKDFAFLGWFYSILMPFRYSIWIKRIAFLLFIAALINYLFIEGYKGYGIFNPTTDAIFSFSLPAIYLRYLYKNMLNVPISKNSYFWISFGLIFTNLIGFFLYLIGDTLHTYYYPLFTKLSISRNGFDMIAQVLLSIGFLYTPFAKYIPLPENEDTQDQKTD